MKHVCFITSIFNRGDSLIVFRQGMSLVDLGYRVSYILCDDLPDDEKYGIEFHSVGATNGGIIKRLRENPRKLKYFLKTFHADIYQINEPELLPLGCWLKNRGFKVVYDLREYYPDYYARKVKNTLLKKIIHFVTERYLYYISQKYDAIFNCMPEMHDYISNVMPCKNFVDVPNFPVVNQDFSLTFDEYCSRENIISYFGSIYNISCQEEFLQAISDIPNVKYLLAGVFYSKEYQDKVMQSKGWRQVIFKGRFSREELPNIINSSIIGNVMKDFNKTETPDGSFSIIKIFESMEAAIPVILAKVPLYEAMVKKYNCGICCDPHNVDEIRNAIVFLLTHKKEAYEMGQNGRKAVIEEYSWDIIKKDYLTVIDNLCNRLKAL
ncbi:glycosyltransferase [Bacteroides pyogenes]|jgi:glycosyltransferase involved in cell wall biosynthesis|uniref:Glycosyltransferase family 4 protein n=1 Tax=Bacteroides pyogenes TaxID=310300 RepID=A0A5D3E7W4_9BACE|nr:glycosyltransferase [Bacteroides pyogenes]MCI7070640.1 glycosyltransferase [Bacteroides pyogenes]TYK32197.1 glycosyltransferase family 4 protein [Bacteroides pyogenes]TYK50009.1 glycosyltransferase family 4 protein [Bacteroides pyogenes]